MDILRVLIERRTRERWRKIRWNQEHILQQLSTSHTATIIHCATENLCQNTITVTMTKANRITQPDYRITRPSSFKQRNLRQYAVCLHTNFR